MANFDSRTAQTKVFFDSTVYFYGWKTSEPAASQDFKIFSSELFDMGGSGNIAFEDSSGNFLTGDSGLNYASINKTLTLTGAGTTGTRTLLMRDSSLSKILEVTDNSRFFFGNTASPAVNSNFAIKQINNGISTFFVEAVNTANRFELDLRNRLRHTTNNVTATDPGVTFLQTQTYNQVATNLRAVARILPIFTQNGGGNEQLASLNLGGTCNQSGAGASARMHGLLVNTSMSGTVGYLDAAFQSGKISLTNAINSAPTPENEIHLSGIDLSAGNTILRLDTEGTGILGVGTPTQDTTVAININGTVYYLLASTSAT